MPGSGNARPTEVRLSIARSGGFTRILRALLAASALFVTAGTARAYPVIISLQDVVFNDGGTAIGSLSLNTYGFAEAGLFTTTTGSTLPGQDFAVPGALAPDYVTDPGGSPWIILFNGAYDRTLWLEVENSPDSQLVGFDPILGGCETNTFQSFCAAANSDTRMILVGGDFNPGLAVPEPAPIAALAVGLLGLSLVRTRRGAGRCESATA